ncbi:MAG: SIR2 family protein [Clostridiales bacterium]|nr:SIR2 family protein [Clostridiales bacterium]
MEYIFDQDVKLLLQSLDMSKIVFWVGAGIDHDSPTNLPLGNGLAKFFISSIWEDVVNGEQAQSDISEIFRKTGDILKNSSDNIELMNFPRLETVTEEISELEEHLKEKGRYSWLNGLECFAIAPANEYHFYLADCIYHGANVVTTNFDVCIPAAYEQIYGICLQREEDEIPGVYIYSSEEMYGCLYYIHGIANDIQNMGVTLKQIKNRLPISFAKIVKQWLENGYTFVFLGYGGVDSYDVNPFFSNNRGVGQNGIYMRFLGNSKDRDPVLRYGEKILLDSFREKVLAVSDSSFWIKQIVAEKGILPGEKMKTESFDWEKQFRRKVKVCPEFNKLARIGITRAIGINYCEIGKDKLPIWPTKREREICSTTYIAYRYFDVLRRTGRKTRAKIIALLGDVTEEIKFNIHNAQIDKEDDRQKYLEKYDFIEKISEMIKNEKEIPWEIVTPLKSITYQYFYDLFLTFKNRCKLKNENRETVSKLLKATEMIIAAGTDYYVEVKELYLLYRCKALIIAGYFDDFENAMFYLHESMKGYADLGELDGLAAVYIERAYISLLMYKKCKNIRDRNQILIDMKTAYKMINLTKDKHNLERYMKGMVLMLKYYVFC